MSIVLNDYIQDDTLKDFFTEYRKEIIVAGIHEYSYERHIQAIQDESYGNDHDDGIKDTTSLFS